MNLTDCLNAWETELFDKYNDEYYEDEIEENEL